MRVLRAREIRKKRGISLVKLCTMTGISPSDISQVELLKRYCYPGWRQRISKALGEPEAVLFEEVEIDEQELS